MASPFLLVTIAVKQTSPNLVVYTKLLGAYDFCGSGISERHSTDDLCLLHSV